MLGASAVQVSTVSYPNVLLIFNYRVHLTLSKILIYAAGTVLNFLNHAGICLECVLLYTPTISSLVASTRYSGYACCMDVSIARRDL